MNIWLSDGFNTLQIENIFSSFKLSDINLNYNVNEYVGANGGYLTGYGNVRPRKITLTRREYVTDEVETNIFNSQRDSLLEWFSKRQDIYLYIQNATATRTVKTIVKFVSRSGDKLSNLKITDSIDFELLMPWGYFEMDAKSIDGGGTSFTLNVNNTGNIACPCDLYFYRLSGSITYINFFVNSEYGIKFGITDNDQYRYFTKSNTLVKAGVYVSSFNYIDSGSPFVLLPGNNVIQVQSDAFVSAQIMWNERFL